MKRVLMVVVALAFAGCGSSGTKGGSTSAGGSSTSSSVGTTTGAGSTAASGSSGATGASGGSGASGSSGSGSSGSTGNPNCYPSGYVGLGNGAMCCSGQTDGAGYCTDASASTSSSSSSGTGTTGTTGSGGTTSSTGTVGTGSSTGGVCPSNMPDLVSGQGGYNAGTCSSNPNSAACPKGYHCDNNLCVLNSSSTLQVTLSFDNIEDFDLHLLEPLGDGGYCEIYYGNPGTNPDAGGFTFPMDAGIDCSQFPAFCGGDAGFGFPTGGNPCPAGWLDLDTNAACGGNNNNGGAHPDGVNTENILFANGQQPPSGTYYVRVDYWQNCDSTTCTNGQDSTACGAGHLTSDLALQVRLPTGAIWQYCPEISQAGQGPNDHGVNGAAFPDNGNAGAGFFVTSFTIP